jgi:hypothetical protein
MKKRQIFNLNRKDTLIAGIVSVFILIVTLVLLCHVSFKALVVAFSEMIDLLFTFSLTFLGFLLTAFTFIQILQSKDWFNPIKKTNAFDQILTSFKILILTSIVCFLTSILLKLSTSLIYCTVLYIIIISLSICVISFLVIFAWRTIAALIELFKA